MSTKSLQPIYTLENVKFAYQLRWGVTIHWQTPVHESFWLEQIRGLLENEGIRILSTRWESENSTQFALSTQPPVSPQFTVQRVKGRLQHSIRSIAPKPLRSHYAIRSFGTQERTVIEKYVLNQSDHHPMASQRSQAIFEGLRYHDSDLDLTKERRTTHASYWYNLHIVLVNTERWRDVDHTRLERLQRGIVSIYKKKCWYVQTYSIVCDHCHLTISCPLAVAPSEVVLSLMNNVAWCYGMRPILTYGAYVATFGEYDQRAVQ